MSVAKFKLDESTKLEFGVQITGAEGRPTARFVIEGKEFSVSYPCRPLDSGGISVEVGNFQNIFTAGEYPVRLEVIIENKIFIPFQDTIILEPNVQVTSKPESVTEVKESITVDKIVIKQPIEEAPKEVIQEEQEPIKAPEIIHETPASKPLTMNRRQLKIASLIAEALDYVPSKGQTPVQIINESLRRRTVVSKATHDLVKDMLRAAIAQGVNFDRDLLKNKK